MDQRLKELEVLKQLADALHVAHDLDTVVVSTYASLQQLDGFHEMSILRPRLTRSSETALDVNTLIVEAATGSGASLVGQRVMFGNGVTGRAARERRIIVLDDILVASPGEYLHIPSRDAAGSEIAVPLQDGEGRLLGVLEAQSRDTYAFTPYMRGLLGEVGVTLSLKLQGIHYAEQAGSLSRGVFNKESFNRQARLEIIYALKNRYDLAMVALDVDKFKKVNDTIGHSAGDEMLAAFGTALCTYGRQTDLFFRWGGDEYIILMPDTKNDEAHASVKRVTADVGRHMNSLYPAIPEILGERGFTFSYGISSLSNRAASFAGDSHGWFAANSPQVSVMLDHLYRLADDGLYRHKDAGKRD